MKSLPCLNSQAIVAPNETRRKGIAMSGTISVTMQQSAIYNAMIPPEGPRSVSMALDFAASDQYDVDFTLAYAQKTISVVQTVWVDNSSNPQPVLFSVAGTGQKFTAPPYAQGSFPVIAAIRPKIAVSSVNSAATVTLLWLNVPLPSSQWYPAGNSSVTPATAQTAASDTIAAGGTAQTVFAAGSIVTQGIVINPSTATETLYVDFVHAAADTAPGPNGTTFELLPGQKCNVPPLTGAVSVNAATTGHAFTAFQF